MRAWNAPWQWLPSALLGVLTVVTAQPAQAQVAVDTAKLSNLVRQDCGSCHGLTLKGGLGKPLTADNLQQWDRDQIVQLILDGVPETPMPGWRPLLTQREAEWIADTLKKGTLR